MWESIISFEDLSFLQRGDFIKISFEPHSQKHFSDPNYDYYFPTYYGKVISSNNKKLDELLVKGKDGVTFYCTNRAGTSGFVSGRYYPSMGNELSFDLVENDKDFY